MAVVSEKQTDESEAIERMRQRIDRLMRSVHNEIKNSDLRFELVARLISARELLNGKD